MDGKTSVGDIDESAGWMRTEMEEIDRGSEIELIDKERDRWRGRRDEKGEPWETLKDEKREFRFLQIHTSR